MAGLYRIYGCFSAKPKSCYDIIFCLKIPAVYEIYSCFSAKSENREAKKVHLKIQSVANFIAIVKILVHILISVSSLKNLPRAMSLVKVVTHRLKRPFFLRFSGKPYFFSS